MKKIPFALLLMLWTPRLALTAQDQCFEDFFAQGMEALQSKNFDRWGEAELDFNAAYYCPAINEEQKALALKKKEEAKNKYIDALIAARDSIGEAKEEIEQQARISRALSWSFIAQEEMAKGNLDAARCLSFHAYQVMRATTSAHRALARKSFGNTVFATGRRYLRGHKSPVLEVAVAPGGAMAITRAQDGNCRLWSLPAGESIAMLAPDGGFVHDIAFAPDGGRILTASADGRARLWDAGGPLLKELEGHAEEVLAVAFSANGQRMLTGSRDGTARLWDAGGTLLTALPGHLGPLWTVAFGPGSGKILTAGADGAKLWTPDGRLITSLTGHRGYLYVARFSHDGSRLLTASADSTAILWDADGRSLTRLEGHQGGVYLARFSSDGWKLLTAATDDTARLWTQGGSRLAELPVPGVLSTAVFSPDGNHLVFIPRKQAPVLWDVSTPGSLRSCPLAAHAGPVLAATFSPDGQSLLTASQDGTAALWDLEGNLIMNIEGFAGPVQSVAFTPDGHYLLAASADGTAVVCEAPEVVFQRWQEEAPCTGVEEVE